MSKKLITIGDFVSMGVVLGRGSFGTVYYGTHKKTKTPVAIKEIDLEKLRNNDKNKKLRNHLQNEIKIMAKLENINVVRLLDCKAENKLLYLVIEYCSRGTFEKYLHSKPNHRLDEDEAKYFMKQFANGLLALRKLKAIHRDLKPDNLLLTVAADGTLLLKIADFGFARLVEEDLSDPLKGLIETFCGTPLYSAPEIFSQKAYTVKSDLWSIGMIFYQMVIGKHPFQEYKTWPDFLFAVQNEPIVFPKDISISDECRSLLAGLLQRDIKFRFTWDQFFSHPFIDLPPVSDDELNNQNNNQNKDDNNSEKNENDKKSAEDNLNDEKENKNDLTNENNENKEQNNVKKDINPEILKQAEEKINEQFSCANAVAVLAKKMNEIDRKNDALALFCKTIHILQTILNYAIKNRENLNNDSSNPFFISFSSKIEEIKGKYGEYIVQAENLIGENTPSIGVEKIIYELAMEYSQRALKEEVDRNFPLCKEYYEFSMSLLSQIKSDCVVEADVIILDKYIETIKYRLSKLAKKM